MEIELNLSLSFSQLNKCSLLRIFEYTDLNVLIIRYGRTEKIE